MASNLTIVKKVGTAPPGGDLTLHATRQVAIDAGDNYVWSTIDAISPDPWQQVEYAGFDGSDAKFMGAKSNKFVITGYVMEAADSESGIITAGKQLRRTNSTQATWTVKIGSADLGSTVGMIMNKIVLPPLGEGTGAEWPFQIFLTDLGV